MGRAIITEEKAGLGKESKLFRSIAGKGAAIPESLSRRHSDSKGILNHRELSDEELVRSFVEAQDEEAFDELVNRYADKIYRLALRITHNPSDAEDVVQEVFITLVGKLNTFHEESKFSTWLHRVASNASFIHLRSEMKYKNNVALEDYTPYNEDGLLEGVEAKDWSGRPDEILHGKEVMEIIENAVNELPEPYRIVFHLRDVEGLTNHEVAKILRLSLPNVKSRILRARLFLRHKLSDYLSTDGKNSSYPFGRFYI